MAEIFFTQYLRPHGRRTVVYIERPARIVELANQIIERGFRFECEELSTGHASLTIVGPEDDVAIEVVRNGPDVPSAVDRLVTNFAVKLGLQVELHAEKSFTE